MTHPITKTHVAISIADLEMLVNWILWMERRLPPEYRQYPPLQRDVEYIHQLYQEFKV